MFTVDIFLEYKYVNSFISRLFGGGWVEGFFQLAHLRFVILYLEIFLINRVW